MFNFQNKNKINKIKKNNKNQNKFGVTIVRVMGGCQMKEAI